MGDIALSNNEEISIKAKTPEGDLEHTFPVTLDSFIEGKSLHQLFARKMIQDLEERQEMEEEDRKSLITDLGLKYNIASKFTSFVGVDDRKGSYDIMITRQVKNQQPAGQNRMFGGMAQVDTVDSSRSFKSMLGGRSKRSFNKSAYMGPPPGSPAPQMELERGPPPGCPAPQMKRGQPLGYPGPQDSTGNVSIFSRPGFGSRASSTFTDSINSNQSKPSSKSKALRLTLTQNANGSFPVTEEVSLILGVSLEVLIKEGAGIDP